MPGLEPVRYLLRFLFTQWRLWLGLALLPLVGTAVVAALQILSKQCFTTSQGNCLLDHWPYGLAVVFGAWSPWLIEALHGLFYIPALTLLYRRLLLNPATEAGGLRFGRRELRFAGYSLLLYYAGLVIWYALWFWLLGPYREVRESLPDTPLWVLTYFGHPFFWPIAVVTLLALSRFYLIFAQAALGRPGGMLALSVHSRGQVLAIVLALLFVRILGNLVGVPARFLGSGAIDIAEAAGLAGSPALTIAVDYAASFPTDYLRAVCAVAVLAWFYRRLVLGASQ